MEEQSDWGINSFARKLFAILQADKNRHVSEDAV